MTLTIRQQIRDRALDELNLDRPTGVPVATKRRFVPGQVITENRIAVFFAEEDTQPGPGPRPSSPLTRRKLNLAIQAIVATERPEDADDAAESMLAHIVERLGKTNLAGLAFSVSELSIVWAAQQSDLFYLVALQRWAVDYQTAKADLTAKQ